uniref:Uncharacterized protein n=1 Tax=Arundo donax TaxID=35708 RepID=A0A0A9AS29_ARUDO
MRRSTRSSRCRSSSASLCRQ